MVSKCAEIGGPCRGRTYGPLIKSPVEDLSQDTQKEESSAKGEDSWGKLQDVHVRQRAKIIPYGVPDRIKNDAT
jgi:hypothetical protein